MIFFKFKPHIFYYFFVQLQLVMLKLFCVFLTKRQGLKITKELGSKRTLQQMINLSLSGKIRTGIGLQWVVLLEVCAMRKMKMSLAVT